MFTQVENVFPKWSRTFTEFGKFSETDKSLKHELDSSERSNLSHMSCWCCGSMPVSYTRGSWDESFNILNFLSLNSLNSVKNI